MTLNVLVRQSECRWPLFLIFSTIQSHKLVPCRSVCRDGWSASLRSRMSRSCGGPLDLCDDQYLGAHSSVMGTTTADANAVKGPLDDRVHAELVAALYARAPISIVSTGSEFSGGGICLAYGISDLGND